MAFRNAACLRSNSPRRFVFFSYGLTGRAGALQDTQKEPPRGSFCVRRFLRKNARARALARARACARALVPRPAPALAPRPRPRLAPVPAPAPVPLPAPCACARAPRLRPYPRPAPTPAPCACVRARVRARARTRAPRLRPPNTQGRPAFPAGRKGQKIEAAVSGQPRWRTYRVRPEHSPPGSGAETCEPVAVVQTSEE